MYSEYGVIWKHASYEKEVRSWESEIERASCGLELEYATLHKK